MEVNGLFQADGVHWKGSWMGPEPVLEILG